MRRYHKRVRAKIANPVLRRNSTEDRLREVYREFLGREPDPDQSLILYGPSDAPDEVAAVGLVTELATDSWKLQFSPEDGVVLALDSRKNIWLLGNAKIEERNEDLGELVQISYVSQKSHIDDEPTEYVHKFGEEGGDRPHLVADHEGWLRIIGGDYYVTSRGIVN